MPVWAAILIGFLGSSAVWGFFEFMIKRHDAKKGVLAEVRSLRADFEEDKAVQARTRILRFSDELLHEDIRHSKEYFDQILTDIDKYNQYCKDHPKFENSKAVASIGRIKTVYDDCLAKKTFL